MTVHTIDLQFLGLENAVAAYLVEAPEGLIMVETGPYSCFPVLESAIQALGWKISDVREVLLSHIHFDHAGAAWVFAEAGAHVHVHPRGLNHLAAPEKLYLSAKQIYGSEMERLWGSMQPIPLERLSAPNHGVPMELGGLTCTPYYTPGHAVHHIAWMIGADNPVLFTGDVAGVRINQGLVSPPCPPPDIQVEDWMDSIAAMRALPAETLYLTHYGPVYDKKNHLDALENRLQDWSAWMYPHALEDTPPELIIPAFEAYVTGQLREIGVDDYAIQQYQAANPAFMSVGGLLRYWRKKLHNAH
jgi:glyoxylase-like metal-dependent hydrolase (beta-lactamase superfamily II)